MVAHVVENVAVQTKQRPSAVVTYILPYYDVRRKEQAKWFAEPETFPQAQRPSLLVVLANIAVYNPATDVLRARQARVFSTPEATVVSKSWQTAPFGPVGYTGDVQRWPQAKYFAEPETFPQGQRASPRTVTDFRQGSADIFHGSDTYGWPPTPVPEYWSPESRGTRTILQAFTAYDFAHDVIGRRPQAKYFGEPEVFPQQALRFLVTTVTHYVPYNPATDVRRQPQFKLFGEPEVFRSPAPYNALIVNGKAGIPTLPITTCGVIDAYDYGNGTVLVAWGPFNGGTPDSYNVYVNGVLNQNVLIKEATITGLKGASYNGAVVTPATTYDIKIVAVRAGVESSASVDKLVTAQPQSVMLTTPMRRPFPFPNTDLD